MAKKEIVDKSVLHDTKIEDIFADAFGRYAKYIIQDRALPDIRDGLKPVQRRIIYAMNDLQILHDKPHKKSARSVGEVIGKYHPHGDTSIYDAMVRMSQSWKNNIPLIDMHGNNGSLDNDPAAAMRYTESRLSLYAELLIKNIRKETVPFIENFDGSEIEPTVLPSLLPNLLINGANGIAAGYATNIPPFNVVELLECLIARIDSPNSRLETILNIMPGPDFPTGGIILNKEGIREAYETGRGKINIRSKIELRTKKQAYITEIPYEVNKAELIDEINEQAEKYDILNINECHDETDQNGVSICINLYNSDNFDFVKNFLYKNTSLQIAYNFNMIAINNRKPCLMGILPYLDAFIKHCDTITLNATNFDLNKAISRKEIVTGLIKAIKVVDQVIDLIRKSNDKQNAKQELMNKMKFTEIQAESIVNLRLYRLSSSDVSELEEELKQLNALIDEFTKIVKDKKYRDNHIKGIFREYKKLFKDNKRKSSFSDEEVNISIDVSETIEDKEIYMIVTRDGYLKNVSIKSFENNEYNDIGLKEGDVQITQFKTNQKNKIIIVTNKGRYVCISIHKIEQTKWKDIGVHINSLAAIELGEKIINAFETNENNIENILVIASKKCFIKRTKMASLINKIVKFSTIMSLNEGDELVSCILSSSNNTDDLIGVITTTGKGLMYPITQVSIVGKNASGVVNTKGAEDIAAIFIDSPKKNYLFIGGVQGCKMIKRDLIPIGKRTNNPKPLVNVLKVNSLQVLNAFMVNKDEEMIFLYDDNKWKIENTKEVEIGDSDTKVSPIRNKRAIYINSLKNLENDDKISDTNVSPSLFDK